MNKTKGLKLMSAIAIILATLVSYLGWKNEVVQNDMKLTLEKYGVLQTELESVSENLKTESEKNVELNNQINEMLKEFEVTNTTIQELTSDEYELVYMGDYKITYYCDERYDHICGGNGVTASGKPTEVGVSAAADWSVLPKGSSVYINGIGWREIQDVGGSVKGKHIDVLVETHAEALKLGTDYEGVWLLVKKNS